ncbi:hypothetical protein MAESPC_00307 [Microcystis aeruginosa SPC777]|uniref:Uncharacterized protein n=1 Tax=Microcystis aeruginosa SPC777 TaxID=482300 RepID=S3JY87_MICAE|nr:hypothetical protein MAESPC_05129 [Microcystis aeruginosa SPC777]EPF24712.1 hypothetical protein MAESPC_00307 [Microcystis aeruginosa SPC777]
MPDSPYLLGQIGLVGNLVLQSTTIVMNGLPPYLLGQIGLVGNNSSDPFKTKIKLLLTY